jgi:hypothetical protein
MTTLNTGLSVENANQDLDVSIIDVIQKSKDVTKAILCAAMDSPEIPWTVDDISVCVYRLLKIDLDMNAPLIVGELLNYFNNTQTELAQGR